MTARFKAAKRKHLASPYSEATYAEVIQNELMGKNACDCPVCGEPCQTVFVLCRCLERHYHGGRSSHDCPICGEVFTAPDSVDKHLIKIINLGMLGEHCAFDRKEW